MSTLMKRLIVAGIGILGAAAAWPLIELLVHGQSVFGSYSMLTVVSGAVFGAVFGLFFASSEGIIAGSPQRIIRGGVAGLVIGLVGGAIGFLVGQLILFLLVNVFFASVSRMDTVGIPVARAVGWAILGIFVGAAEGIRARSPRKVVIGAVGGVVGGLLGGAAIEYSTLLFPFMPAARLAGLLLFGLLVSVFYGIVERQLSYGVLRLLNGRYKGKEFIVNQRRMTLGSSPLADIVLGSYRNVEPRHAVARVRRGDLYLEPRKDATVLVNDEAVERQRLKFEDVVKLGSARLYYKAE